MKKGEEEKTVRGWIDDGKYYSSVKYMFDNCKVNELDDEGLKSYILGALTFGLVLGEYNYDAGRNVRSMLEQQHFDPKQYKLGKNVVIQWLDKKIDKLEHPVVLTKLLNRFYVATEYDENNRVLCKQLLLITNDDVVKMLQKAMSVYLDHHSELTALSLFYEKSEVGKVFKNCCVQIDDRMMNDEYNAWENVAIDTVVSHFKGQAKQAIEDEKMAYDNMYMDDMPEWDNDPEAQFYYENAYEQRERQLNAYFGSKNEPFNKLIEACFTNDANDNVIVNKTQNIRQENNKPKKKKRKKKR